jgi:hypothetical protein
MTAGIIPPVTSGTFAKNAGIALTTCEPPCYCGQPLQLQNRLTSAPPVVYDGVLQYPHFAFKHRFWK